MDVDVNCDKCKKDFEIDIKVKKHTGGIEEIYFRCPYCKKKYTSYFTDKNIRKQQKEISKLYPKYRDIDDSEQIEKGIEEINEARQKLSTMMGELKEKMTKK